MGKIQNWVEAEPSTKSSFPPFLSGQKLYKNIYQSFFALSNFTWFLDIVWLILPANVVLKATLDFGIAVFLIFLPLCYVIMGGGGGGDSTLPKGGMIQLRSSDIVLSDLRQWDIITVSEYPFKQNKNMLKNMNERELYAHILIISP